MPKSPFSPHSVEITPVLAQTSIAEVSDRSEDLPVDYRECLVTRYVQKREAVTRQVADGTLPDMYQLPELSVMLKRAVSLAPTYEIMARNNWEPDVVFVPRGLSLVQWNALLTGHRLADHNWTEGLHRTWAGFELAHPTSHEAGASPWGVAVISGAERPVLVGVSKDGEHGFNAQRAIRALSELPYISDPSSAETVVQEASPMEERYFALQLARLERGEKPVDSKTWTIGRENLEIGEEMGSLYFYFRPKQRQFMSIWRSRDAFDNNDGVRPSVGDEDVAPRS
jgi:hypothetical protein